MQYAGYKAAQTAGKEDFEEEILADGDYSGEYRFFGVKTAASVQFSIRDKKLYRFNIDKILSTPGHDVKEHILHAIKPGGDLNFDAVSGATVSSQFVRAAIKNAVRENTL